MKRLFLLLLALALAAGLAGLGRNIWQTTRQFEEGGRPATLVVGKRYNTERWASPLPVKKIYTYTARMEPKYEVLIETDQDLKPGQTVPIRFLTHDLAAKARAFSLRPLVNTVRLRGPDDMEPVMLPDTDLFDRWVDKAMGPPAEGVHVAARATAEAAPGRARATVPFLIAEATDDTWALIRRNSRVGEWAVLVLAILAVPSLLSSAWERQQAARRPNPNRKDFVHPSLRRIEADAAPEPSRKLTYVAKAEEEIVLPEAEKRRLAEEVARKAAPPPTAPITPAEAAEPPSLSANETAPPMPINKGVEPTLKLRRNK